MIEIAIRPGIREQRQASAREQIRAQSEVPIGESSRLGQKVVETFESLLARRSEAALCLLRESYYHSMRKSRRKTSLQT